MNVLGTVAATARHDGIQVAGRRDADMDDEDPYRRWDAPALVAGALGGDSRAWTEIVRRHTPAVVARVRQFRLTPHQAEDVAQTVWLNLLENLEKLRDPHALPGWIATTARHECIRVTNVNRRTVPVDPQTGRLDGVSDSDLDERMLRGRTRAGAARRARGAARPPARHPADARGGPTAQLRGDRREARRPRRLDRPHPGPWTRAPATDGRDQELRERPGRPPRLEKEDAMSWHSDDRAHSSTGPASPWADDEALGADLIDRPGRAGDLRPGRRQRRRGVPRAPRHGRRPRRPGDGPPAARARLRLHRARRARRRPRPLRRDLAHARLRGRRPRRRGGGRVVVDRGSAAAGRRRDG